MLQFLLHKIRHFPVFSLILKYTIFKLKYMEISGCWVRGLMYFLVWMLDETYAGTEFIKLLQK